jgi:hypothetical protein
MTTLIKFIRITLWIGVWFSLLAFTIEVVNNLIVKLYQTDLDNLKTTNVLLENILVKKTETIQEQTDVLKTLKLSKKGQALLLRLDSLQKTKDSIAYTFGLLDMQNVEDEIKAIEILQALKKRYFDDGTIKSNTAKHFSFINAQIEYLKENKTWIMFYIRPLTLYKLAELHYKSELINLQYDAIMFYKQLIEKEVIP